MLDALHFLQAERLLVEARDARDVLRFDAYAVERDLGLCGGEPGETSNNRMELTAPIAALEALTRPVVVHLHTDSTYVRNGITKWVSGWERNGWLTAAKQPVKNVDLWQRLQAACARHQVEWFWVKGHSGVADNELADELATRGLQEAIAASAMRTVAGGARPADDIDPLARRS